MNRSLGLPARAMAMAAVVGAMIAGGAALGADISSADQIRDLRAQYNQVIARRDAAGFARFLSPTFVEMSSTGDVVRGAKAVADSYATGEFKDPAFIAYDRQPDSVEVAPNGRLAIERGHWRARFRGPGGAEVGGSGLYQAGWAAGEGGWRIQSEAYAPLTCKHAC